MGALDRKSLDKQKRFKLKINQFFEIILKQKIIIEYFFTYNNSFQYNDLMLGDGTTKTLII